MSNARKILPECYADTLLIEHLGFKKPNHQQSLGMVLKTMNDRLQTGLAIGVIDDDKAISTKYYREFKIIEQEEGVSFLKHSTRKHYLLVHPILEKFLLAEADKAAVDFTKYGIKNIKSLKKITKSQHVGRNAQFKQFLNTLYQKKAPGLMFLKKKLMEHLGDSY